MKKAESLCSLILSVFLQKIGKKDRKILVGPSGHFPTFVGEVKPVSFVLYGVSLTLCSHMQLDEKEFVFKLFLGSDPKQYFGGERDRKKFSEKAYRQNDPFLLKIIYHDPKTNKESWIEEQLPLHKHKPYVTEIVKAVRKVEDLFFQAEKKAKRKF